MLKAKIERVWVEVLPDTDPDTSYLYQADPDFSERRELYERGGFDFVGVRACAELRFETEQGGWIIGPTITTPGLWGIESDSGEDYLQEVGAEEADQLPDMLQALGVSRARANYARRMTCMDLKYR